MTDAFKENVVRNLATLNQQVLDGKRQVESYHASVANYEIMRREDRAELSRTLGLQIEVAIGQLKEHINMVGAKQREDIQESRDYCETENKLINKSLGKLSGRLDKFVYMGAGGFGVIGIIAGIIEWAT